MGHVAFDGMPLGDLPENPINAGERISGTATVKNTDWFPGRWTHHLIVFHLYDNPDYEDPYWEKRFADNLHVKSSITYTLKMTMPRHDVWISVELHQDVGGEWKFVDDCRVWLDNPEWEPQKQPWWEKEVMGVPAYQIGAGAIGVAAVMEVAR